MSVGKINRPGHPFANVAAGQLATAVITPGRTIEVLTLACGGTFTPADIEWLKIKANGKPVVDCTGAALKKIAEFRGFSVTTHLPIFFSDFEGLDSVDQDVGGFDTSHGIESMSIEVKIGPGPGVVSPTLYYQLQESVSQLQTGAGYAPLLAKILRYPYQVATGGNLPIALPFGPVNGATIKRLHISQVTPGNVTGLVIKQDHNTIHETLKADNDAYNVRFKRVNQAGLYSVDFVANGGMKNAFDTRDAASLELIPTFTAADSGEVIVEYLDVLGNL